MEASCSPGLSMDTLSHAVTPCRQGSAPRLGPLYRPELPLRIRVRDLLGSFPELPAGRDAQRPAPARAVGVAARDPGIPGRVDGGNARRAGGGPCGGAGPADLRRGDRADR